MTSAYEAVLGQSVDALQKLDKGVLGFVRRDRSCLGRFDAVCSDIIEWTALYLRPAFKKYLRLFDRADRTNTEITILGPDAYLELLHGSNFRITTRSERLCEMEVA